MYIYVYMYMYAAAQGSRVLTFALQCITVSVQISVLYMAGPSSAALHWQDLTTVDQNCLQLYFVAEDHPRKLPSKFTVSSLWGYIKWWHSTFVWTRGHFIPPLLWHPVARKTLEIGESNLTSNSLINHKSNPFCYILCTCWMFRGVKEPCSFVDYESNELFTIIIIQVIHIPTLYVVRSPECVHTHTVQWESFEGEKLSQVLWFET